MIHRLPLWFVLILIPAKFVFAKPLPETTVVVHKTWTIGSTTALRVQTGQSADYFTMQPTAARCTAVLSQGTAGNQNESMWPLAEFDTDPARDTPIAIEVPTVAPARYEVTVTCVSALGDSTVSESVQLVDSTAMYVITDRPRYRPGQTIRVRLSVVRPTDHRPSPSRTVQLVLRDPRKTAVWQQSTETNAAGFALAEIPLTDDLLTGTYRLETTVGSQKKSMDVVVRAEKNPPFALQVQTQTNAGGDLKIDGTARYFYGEPVVGKAAVYFHTQEGHRQEQIVELDANGGFVTTLPTLAKDRNDPIDVAVTDEAGRRATQSLEISTHTQDWTLVVLPAAEKVGAGGSSYVTVCTLDPAGALLPTTLTLTVPGQKRQTVQSPGITRIPFVAPTQKPIQRAIWTTRSWTLESKSSASVPPELPDTTTDSLLGALIACIPHDESQGPGAAGKKQVVVTVDPVGQSFRVGSVKEAPFSDSPDFLMEVPDPVSDCVRRKFGATAKKSPEPMRLTLRVDLAPERIDTFEEQVSCNLGVKAIAQDGSVKTASAEVEVDKGMAITPPILDSRVIQPGEDIRLRRFGTSGGYAVLIRDKTQLAAASCVPTPDGFSECRIVPPKGMWGLATVAIVDVSAVDNQPTTELHTQTLASVFLRPQTVDLQIDAPERVRPSSVISLPVQASLPSGDPAAGIGLAASIIDEAALSLGPRFPALLTSLLEDEHRRLESLGPNFAHLLQASAEHPIAVLAMDAILNEVPAESTHLWAQSTLGQRREQERRRLSEKRHLVYGALLHYPGAIVRFVSDAGGCEYIVAMDEMLARAGVNEAERQTAWSHAYRFEEAERIDVGYACPHVARHVSYQRLETLATWLDELPRTDQKTLKKRPAETWARWVDQDRVSKGLTIDAWGQPVVVRRTDEGIQIRTAGEDRKLDTSDDLVKEDVLQESVGHHGFGLAGYGTGAGGGAFGSRSTRGVASINQALTEPDAVAAVRRRFDETVLWSADTWTDASGRAVLETTLADSITRWEVSVDALGPDGSIGHAKTHVETFLPLFVDLSVPDYLTEGDLYFVPIQVANYSGIEKPWTVTAEFSGTLVAERSVTQSLNVPTGHTGSTVLAVRATHPGVGTLRVHLQDETGKTYDTIEKTIPVIALGLMQRAVYSLPRNGGELGLAFSIPNNARPETLTGKIRLFRDALDGARDGLEGMLREPNGCFEQTSSTTYPNLLILRLLGSQKNNEALRAKATDLVGRGYQKLLRFEVPGGGFSWFGDAPANRVLTAYGLVEFVDMQQVYPVDSALIERTQKWLLSQQNPDGSFSPDKSWLHDWSAVQGKVSTTAYIAWALAEAGQRGTALTKALRFLETHRAELQNNPYLLGLWAKAASVAGQDASFPLAQLRLRTETQDGMSYVKSKGKTLMYGNHLAADVEVTALAAASRFLANEAQIANEHLDWLWKNRHMSYGWGTTQATILALRAMAEIEQHAAEEAPESTTLVLDGRPIGTLSMSDPAIPTLDLSTLGLDLKPGSYTLSVPVKAPVRGEMRLAWFSKDKSEATDTGLEVRMNLSRVQSQSPATRADGVCPAGTEIAVRLGIRNKTASAMAMPTVLFPLAPGYVADPDSLAALVKNGSAEKAENHGDRVVLYVEKLLPDETKVFDLKVISQAASVVMQPAAQAYVYYEPDTAGASRSEQIVCGGQDKEAASEAKEAVKN